MTLTGKLDPTTIILVLIAAILVAVLAITKAVTGATIENALIFILGVIGGVVNPLTKAPATPTTTGMG